MNDASELERCRTEADLRAAYARAMSEQVSAPPPELAVLRDRFRLRRGELRRGLGGTLGSRADWVVACLESSLPDESLEAELLRLTAEDPHLDVPRLRSILAAREEWRTARTDPRVPGVVLHVIERRLGVPPRAPAIAEDVAFPKEVAELVDTEYPRLRALDRQMFTQLGQAARREALLTEHALQRHQQAASKSGKGAFWTIVVVIWIVSRVLSWLGDDAKSPSEIEPANGVPAFEYKRSTQFGAEFDRVSRRLARVARLREYIQGMRSERVGPLDVTNSQRETIRQLLDPIPVSVTELREVRAACRADPGYPRALQLKSIEDACWRATSTLVQKQAHAQLRFVQDWRHPLQPEDDETGTGDK